MILGISYKNINDLRESAAIRIMKLFKRYKINFRYHDRFFDRIKLENNSNVQNKSLEINKKNISNFDGILLTTDHDKVDYDLIFKYSKLFLILKT